MSREIVAQANADLVAAGKDLSGDNGAFLITMEAAFRLGLGVVDKPNGHHAEYPMGSGHFFSVDGIMDRAGNFFDVLINGGAGGTNEPTWQPNGTVDVSRYRPAVSILGSVPPVVVPPPPPPSVDLSGIEQKLQGLMEEQARLRAGQDDIYQQQIAVTAAMERLIAAFADFSVPVPTVTFPDYITRGFGGTIVSKPR